MARRPDGIRVPFPAYPTPLRDRLGALTGAVNTLIDITERKRSEQVEKRLALIVESTEDAIVSADVDGIIGTWNGGSERLFGYLADEVIGKPIMLLMPMELLRAFGAASASITMKPFAAAKMEVWSRFR